MTVERGEVICATSDGPVAAPALLTAHLAVHHSLVDGKVDVGKSHDWTLTHRASGLAMNWYDTRREAKAAAVKLEAECARELKRIAGLAHGKSLKQGTTVGKRLREGLGR